MTQLLKLFFSNKKFIKIEDLPLIRVVLIALCFILFVFPVALQADITVSSKQEMEADKTVEIPKELTQKQINDLFGEDPYLGQTSYLQSPDGFSQRKK